MKIINSSNVFLEPGSKNMPVTSRYMSLNVRSMAHSVTIPCRLTGVKPLSGLYGYYILTRNQVTIMYNKQL